MANLIDGADVAEWLGLADTEENTAKYAEVAAVASLLIEQWCVIPVNSEPVVLAAKMLAARLARRATTPEGIGGLAGDGGVYYVSRTDPDIAFLLDPYRKLDGFA